MYILEEEEEEEEEEEAYSKLTGGGGGNARILLVFNGASEKGRRESRQGEEGVAGREEKMKEYYGVTMEWRSDIYSIRLSRVSLPRPGPPGVDIAGVVTCSLSINRPPSDSPYWEDDCVFE